MYSQIYKNTLVEKEKVLETLNSFKGWSLTQKTHLVVKLFKKSAMSHFVTLCHIILSDSKLSRFVTFCHIVAPLYFEHNLYSTYNLFHTEI